MLVYHEMKSTDKVETNEMQGTLYMLGVVIGALALSLVVYLA